MKITNTSHHPNAKQQILFVFLVSNLFFSACGPVTPVPLPVEVVSDLEIITPENISRLDEVEKRGRGELDDYALSPNGKIFAISTSTGIYYYDAKTLDEVHFGPQIEFKSWQSPRITSITFSPDKKRLAIAHGSEISILDLSTRERRLLLSHAVSSIEITSIQFSPDGNFLEVRSVTGNTALICERGEMNIALYNVKDFMPIYNQFYCFDSIVTSRFTSDNKFYIFFEAEQPYEFVVVETSTGNRLQRVEYEFTYLANTESVAKIYDISPDGSVFAAVQHKPKGVVYKLLDSKTFNVIETTEGQIRFSQNPDFRWIDFRNGDWKLQTKNGKPLCTFGYLDGVPGLLNPDGKTALSVTMRGMKLWDLSTCQVNKSLDFISAVDHLTISPEGKTFAYEDWDHLYLEDVQTGQIQHTFPLGSVFLPVPFAFNLDGSKIYTITKQNDDQFYRCVEMDVGTGKPIRILGYESGSPHFVAVPNADRIVFWDRNKVDLWDLRNDQLIQTISSNARGIDISPDRTEILIVEKDYANPSHDRTLRVNLQTGELIKEFSTPKIISISYVSDRRAFAVYWAHGEKEKYVTIDLQNGNALSEFDAPTDSQSGSGKFTLTKENIFITFDKVWIQMRDLDNLSLTRILGKISNLTGLRLSHDERILISVSSTQRGWNSYESTLQFWDARTGEFLVEKHLDDFYSYPEVVFSPDSSFITIAGNGTIRIWGVPRKP